MKSLSIKDRVDEYIAKKLLERFIYTASKGKIEDSPDLRFDLFDKKIGIECVKISDESGHKFDNSIDNFVINNTDNIDENSKIFKRSNEVNISDIFVAIEENIKSKLSKLIKYKAYSNEIHLFITLFYEYKSVTELNSIIFKIKQLNFQEEESFNFVYLLVNNKLLMISKNDIKEFHFSNIQYDFIRDEVYLEINSKKTRSKTKSVKTAQ